MLPSYADYPELKPPTNCTNTCRTLNATSEETEALDIVNQARVMSDDVELPFLELGIKPGPYSNATQLAFDWKCVQMTHDGMQI